MIHPQVGLINLIYTVEFPEIVKSTFFLPKKGKPKQKK